jgi:hypothetical protein
MKHRTVRIVVFALLAWILGAVTAPAQTVPLYGTAEIALIASAAFDGDKGTPNPFDFDVAARVTSPSGKRSAAGGFFDGDGQGGAVGRIFKLRIPADEPGKWSWSVESNAPGLDGLAGTFNVQGRLPGVFGRGPIVEAAGRPRAFQRRDGGAVFLVGKFLDVAAPSPIQFSHTFLSEKLTDANREAMLARHRGMGLNKINVYLANRGDYGGVSTTPWVGTAADNDKRRFDLRRWSDWDRWIVRLRDAGMVAELWFFADDSGFGDLSDADRQRLIRYGMARLSGYVNTMFTLALEWQEGWTPAEVQAHGEFLQKNNPWARLVSVHGTTGDFAFPNAPWVDFLAIQAGNDSNPLTVHQMGLTHRERAAKPVIQEELGMGEENASNRRKAWAAFTAGAAGVGTGAFLKHLAAFAARVTFDRMEPADGLVASRNGWALAAKGSAYVIYLTEGDRVGVNLRGAPGSYKAEWFDPRDGSSRPAPSVQGGRVRAFTAPSADDWVLYIHK